MRFKTTLILNVCALCFVHSCVLASDPAEQVRLPISVIESMALFQEYPAQPLLKVGRSPDDERVLGHNYYDLYAASKSFGHVPPTNHMRIDRMLAGSADLRPAQAGLDTYLFLLGPMLDTNEEWSPEEISRTGKTLTVVADKWTDEMPREKNIPQSSAWLLSLGILPPGDYELVLRCRNFNKDAQAKSPNYKLKSVLTGSVKFTVNAGAAPNAKAASLTKADLTEQKVDDDGREYQAASFAAFRSDVTERNPPPNVEAGAFNLSDLRNTHARPLQNLPVLEPPAPGKSLCALITAPPLTGMDYMSLREISWKENTATITVEVWSGGVAHKKVPGFHPKLLVELLPPNTKPGKIQVKWIMLSTADHVCYKPEGARLDMQAGRLETDYKITDEPAPPIGTSSEF